MLKEDYSNIIKKIIIQISSYLMNIIKIHIKNECSSIIINKDDKTYKKKFILNEKKFSEKIFSSDF